MRRSALALLAATIASAAVAQPVAYFLTGTIPGTLRYQVVIEGAGRGEISGTLGDLTNLEVLAGPILAQEIAWRGAQPVAVTALTWVVRARTLGTIAVGPTRVRLGDAELVTNPVTGAALAGGRAGTGGAQPGVRVDLSASSVAIGEALVVRFSLEGAPDAAGAGWEIQASFPDSWSERLPPGEAHARAARPAAPAAAPLGGWLVIPVRAGRLEIPPAVARAAEVGADEESPDLPGRTLTSKPAWVEVVPPPPAPAPFFGAVGDLEFARRLTDAEPSSGELTALEVEVRGTGNLPLLDLPQLALPEGVRAFPAEESHAWQASRRGLAGWRRWRIPLEATRPGRYELPAVTFCSYRPGRSYATHALPALALVVRPSAPTAPAPPDAPGRERAGATPLILLAAAFVAGGLAVLAVRRRGARRASSRPDTGTFATPDAELRALQLAVEEWARSSWGAAVGEGPDRLVAAGCPADAADEAAALVRTLERLRFAPGLSDPEDALADLRLRVRNLTLRG